MPMLLIKGTYKIVGASPDGDSVRFYPDDPDQWDLLPGRRVRRNRSGGAQLRLDGIDTLEPHYRPPRGPELHQPAPFAGQAADELLSWLGFDDVQRNTHGTVTDASPASRPGYILTRSADVNGRCVAVAGRGTDAPGRSGTLLTVTPDHLRATANHHQLAEGLAYPTFYRKLFVDLRKEMTSAVEQARQADKGLWRRSRRRRYGRDDGRGAGPSGDGRALGSEPGEVGLAHRSRRPAHHGLSTARNRASPRRNTLSGTHAPNNVTAPRMALAWSGQGVDVLQHPVDLPLVGRLASSSATPSTTRRSPSPTAPPLLRTSSTPANAIHGL
jgi:endonuclease YncB( thermonuclease family)